MPIKLKHRLGGISNKCFLLVLWGACFLSLSPYIWSQESTEWKLKVSAMSASIRLKPDLESPVIATLPKGTSLNSYEAEGDWFRVVLPPSKDGIVIIGYIAKSEVQILEEKIRKQTDFWRVEEGGFKGLGFHLMLSGGWALFPSGDIDRGAKGLYNIGADAIAARGVESIERNTKPLRSALNLSGDIVYDLGPKIGIGIGFGYIHTLGVDSFRYSERKVYENSLNSATDLTVVTFRLGAFYALPIGRRFLLRLNAGPAIFFTNLTYNRNASGLDFEESFSLKGKTTNLGFQGGARHAAQRIPGRTLPENRIRQQNIRAGNARQRLENRPGTHLYHAGHADRRPEDHDVRHLSDGDLAISRQPRARPIPVLPAAVFPKGRDGRVQALQAAF